MPSAIQPSSSGDERSGFGDFAFLFLAGGPSSAWQLQHGCMLAFAQVSDQHDLSIRELQRIVMGRRPIEIDLAEASHFVCRFPGGQEAERSIAFDFFFERKFSPGQKADGYARLTGIAEAARDGIWKLS